MKKFPQLGSIVTKELKLKDDQPSGILLKFKLVGASKVRSWMCENQSITLAEIRRVALERKASTREASPELWDGYQTPEGVQAQFDFAKKVLKECLVGVEGMQVGDLDLSLEKDPDKLIQALDDANILDRCVNPAFEAQQPSEEAFLS